MSKFDEFMKDAFEKGQGVVVAFGSKAKSAYDEARALSKNEDAWAQEIYDLGLEIYSNYKDKDRAPIYRQFAEKFQNISALEAENEELRAALDEKFGRRTCTCCGEKIKLENVFCPYCGTEQPKPEPEPEPEPDPYKENQCPYCGVEHADHQSFCGNCGNKL